MPPLVLTLAHTLQPFWILLGQEEQFIEYFLIEIKVGLVLSGIIWHVDKQFLNDILKNYENHIASNNRDPSAKFIGA